MLKVVKVAIYATKSCGIVRVSQNWKESCENVLFYISVDEL